MPGPRFRRARPLMVESLEMRLPLATFYVSPSGNDASSGAADAPWQTLQQAADRVRAGDTVVVLAGNYVGFDLRQSGTAASPIVFHAESGATITQRNFRTADGINLEGADYVTVEGFSISNMPRAGIRAVENQSVTIRNNRIDASARWGIFTGFSDDLLIEDNVVSRAQLEHGIYVSNSGDRPVIRHNTVWGSRDNGIHMNGDAAMGGDGVISGALVEANVLFDNSSGGGSAINADGVQNSTFRNNLIYNTHAAGISLYRMDGGGPSTGNVVANNTVLVAADGRWALQVNDGSTGNTVRNNVFHNDGSFPGSLSVSADSLPGFSSDYNALTGRFTTNGGGSVLNLAQWRAATLQDAHSFIASPAELFVNPAAGDFHLPPGSPAVDAGTTLFAPPIDLEGTVRPSGTGVDIGAFELPVASSAGGPSALYHFDQSSGSTAADSSGNGQTATIVNQPLLGQPGVTAAGTSILLNGINQYVALPAAPFGDPASPGFSASFETWFRAAPGTSGVILSQTAAGATPGGAIPGGYVPVVHLGSDGKLRSTMFWHGDAGARVVSPGAETYNDGSWHHVAVTYAGGIEILYLDGVAVGQQARPEVPYAAAYNYFLGTGQTSLWAGGNGGWHFFSGQLDEAAIYPRALSPTEVAGHFAAASQASASAWYRLDETSGAAAADSSGNGQTAAYVNQPTLAQPGAVLGGTAASFNGANQYVALPSAPFGNAASGPLSFETWFQATPGTSGVILSQAAAGATPGGATPGGYVPVVHLGTDGRIRSTMFWHGSAGARVVSPGTYNDGLWHHVAVTYAGGVESLYLDGALVGEQAQPSVAYAAAYSYFLGTGQTALWAGGNGGWHFFSGQLDEAAIYDRALAPAEIASHATLNAAAVDAVMAGG